jgi:signal transduction histidine kinase
MLAGIRVLMSPLTIGNIFAALVSVFGIYWGVYGIHLRREAQALDRQRMSQLESTYRQLQETHQRLIDTTQAVVESRAREARLETLADIHDGVGHRLTSLIIGLESLEMMLPDDPHTARTRVTDLVAIAREALQDVRQAVRARSYDPPDFDRQSFDRLIERVRHNGQMRIDAELPESINHWPDLTRMTLYHILQESLTNVLRHAKADRVRVTLRRQLASVILQVADNGILVQPLIPGFGLVRLRQRCEALGGELQLSVAHPHGLDLQATLPLSQEVNVE